MNCEKYKPSCKAQKEVTFLVKAKWSEELQNILQNVSIATSWKRWYTYGYSCISIEQTLLSTWKWPTIISTKVRLYNGDRHETKYKTWKVYFICHSVTLDWGIISCFIAFIDIWRRRVFICILFAKQIPDIHRSPFQVLQPPSTNDLNLASCFVLSGALLFLPMETCHQSIERVTLPRVLQVILFVIALSLLLSV